MISSCEGNVKRERERDTRYETYPCGQQRNMETKQSLDFRALRWLELFVPQQRTTRLYFSSFFFSFLAGGLSYPPTSTTLVSHDNCFLLPTSNDPLTRAWTLLYSLLLGSLGPCKKANPDSFLFRQPTLDGLWLQYLIISIKDLNVERKRERERERERERGRERERERERGGKANQIKPSKEVGRLSQREDEGFETKEIPEFYGGLWVAWFWVGFLAFSYIVFL